MVAMLVKHALGLDQNVTETWKQKSRAKFKISKLEFNCFISYRLGSEKKSEKKNQKVL